MNGDGDSCNDSIADFPTDVEITQEFVSTEGPNVAEEESVSCILSDQTPVYTPIP